MKSRRIFPLVLAGVLTAASVLPCYGATTKEKISNVQAEQAAAQSQLDSIQVRMNELNEKKGKSEEYLTELDRQLTELKDRLEELSQQYGDKQEELVQVQSDLEKAKEKEEEQYEAMKLRIQYMYENSAGNGYLTMLLSSRSISELLNRAEYIQRISDFDRDLMEEYQQTVHEVQTKEQQVKEEQAAIRNLQEESTEQQEAVQELYAAGYQELRSYMAELDSAASSQNKLISEINSKEEELNGLIRQAKEEEIAAKKREQEEAAAKAAKEAKAKQEQAAKTASSGTGKDTSGKKENVVSKENPSGNSSGGTYLGRFKLTGYCSCPVCCGSWSGGGTASGTTPVPGRTIAMGGVPFGTKLLINGQVYTVEDRGTAYGHVDVFCGSHAEAIGFGVQYADVYQIN